MVESHISVDVGFSTSRAVLLIHNRLQSAK